MAMTLDISIIYASLNIRVIHSYPQPFTKRKRSKKRKERPTTDFSAAPNGNVNGKEDGNGTNKKPDVSTCLKYRTFLFVLDIQRVGLSRFF
jgi:hypothetical protein